MIYELTNPHDPYTFEAPDTQVAALVCLLLGNAYGAEPVEGDDGWPVVLFASSETIESAFKDRWGSLPHEALRVLSSDVAKALRSLWITGVAERVGVQAALDACPTQEARDAFVAAYEDRKRTSVTDLATRARSYADTLDRTAEAMEKEAKCPSSSS